MIRSLKLRIALASALLTGLVLAVFAASAWWLIRDVKLTHADNLLRTHAEREAGRPAREFDWARAQANMAATMGLGAASDLALLVLDDRGEAAYQSERWPGNLAPSSLPWPVLPERERPPMGMADPMRAEDPPPRAGERGGPRPDRPQWRDDTRPPRPPRAERGPRPVATLHVAQVGGVEWRIGLASTDRGRIAVALATRSITEDMGGIGGAFLIAVPIALLVAGLGAWVVSAGALRPIRKLTAAAQRVSATGLDQRIAATGEDREFGQLIAVFNGMLERLQRSFEQAYRFSGDAAHELKTPLAILQGQVEQAINQAEPGSALQESLTGILDEVRRLSTISRKLLLLSQADAGRLSLYREPFALSEALAELAEDARMLAPQLEVTEDIPPGIVINADGSLLKQALHNLISNAIKYNVNGGWIRIAMTATQAQVRVVLTNASLGIPARDRQRVFERFYRADQSRNRGVDGVGLGLALSREIARAHGGDLSFSVEADDSVRLVLEMPRAAGASA